MANKITIIGAGQVGSSVAYALCLKGIATEIVLIDIDEKRAKGEAMDIRQGTPYMAPVNIHAGTYEDAKNSDIVVITSGVGRKPGQSRLDLAQINVNIFKSIIPQITKAAPDAIYVLVANPVDVLTYQLAKSSNIPANHIIGTGTLLDTARLRTKIADEYGIGQTNLHAYVFGEHGDSSFVPWSLVNIASVPVDDYNNAVGNKHQELNRDDVEEYVRKSGGMIIEAKKCTNYAIGVTTAKLCELIQNNTPSVTIVSTMLKGEYGIEDVCLSIPTVVGGNGVEGRLAPALTDEEVAKLKASADALKKVISQLDFN